MTTKSRQSYRNQLIVNSESCSTVQRIQSLDSGNSLTVRLALVISDRNVRKNISSWWTGRDLKNHTYWHGNESDNATGCACASTGSCERFAGHYFKSLRSEF